MSQGATEATAGVDNMKIPFQKPIEVVGSIGKQNINQISGKPSLLNNSEDLEKAMQKMSTASMAPALITDFGDIGGGAHFQHVIDLITPNKSQDTKSAMKTLKMSEEPEVPKIMELEVAPAVEEQATEYAVPRSAS